MYYLKIRYPECKVAIASYGMCDMITFTLDELFKQSNFEGHRKEYIPDNLIFGGIALSCLHFGFAAFDKNYKDSQIEKIKKFKYCK